MYAREKNPPKIACDFRGGPARKKNGFFSDFDGRKNRRFFLHSPFFLWQKKPEIGGNNGSLRAPIVDRRAFTKFYLVKALRSRLSLILRRRIREIQDRDPERTLVSRRKSLAIFYGRRRKERSKYY